MLSLLHIENIAIIESCDIHFDAGFNVLTGETGAGKSIVIDAISAVLGQRTSRELIRTGAKSATVSAQFTGLPKIPWLDENGFPGEEELVLQREIYGNGRNACRVNGKLISVGQLQQLGRNLLDIHGQHDGQQLLDPACHLSYLDSFGNLGEQKEAYQSQYDDYMALKKKIRSLTMDEAERSRRVDILRYQIRELERARLRDGEEERLEARRKLLYESDRLISGLRSAADALGGTSGREGVVELLDEAEQGLRGISDLNDQLHAISEEIAVLSQQASIVQEAVEDLRREMDFDPQELDRVETRLALLSRLERRYGSSVAEMKAFLDRSKKELDQIASADDTLKMLHHEMESARKATLRKGEELSAARKKAALALQARVQEELRQLDMPRVTFETEFQPSAGEGGMDVTGIDQVQFLMSANMGEALKPIQKVASGGELARIMLALKNVLAEDDGIGSLVFDEVDTGVSGRAAQKVAEKMADVARHKQVLCVTHLPQIAAMADAHFSVQKDERDGRTYTNVTRLNRKGREGELGRLIGSGDMTETMQKSAAELLNRAEEYRKGIIRPEGSGEESGESPQPAPSA